jgi:hypothetical protein
VALDWVRQQGQWAIGLALAGALAPFWGIRGHASEGRRWLAELIAKGDMSEVPAAVRARAFYGVGTPLPVPEHVVTEQTATGARMVMGETAWAGAVAAGRALPLAQAIADALGSAPYAAASATPS